MGQPQRGSAPLAAFGLASYGPDGRELQPHTSAKWRHALRDLHRCLDCRPKSRRRVNGRLVPRRLRP